MTDDRMPRWPAMDVDQRTEQYSPSTMLDGPLDPYLDDYANRSAAAYEELSPVVTLAYGDRPSNTVDVALPPVEDRPAVPLHVFIHGGYWQQLSKTESFFLARDCVTRGQAFAAIDYTLAPQAGLDQIVSECLAAINTVRAAGAAGRIPISPEHIVISGSSAGAHLAAMVCCRLPAGARPAGVVLVSGVYDLEPLVATPINDAVGLDVAAAQRNSPSRHDLANFPPTVLAWGDNEPDEFKRQSRMFADLIRADGGSASEAEVAGRNHFDVVFDIVPDLTDLLPQ